jgi:hypothetical protein
MVSLTPPTSLSLGNEPRYLLDRRLDGPQNKYFALKSQVITSADCPIFCFVWFTAIQMSAKLTDERQMEVRVCLWLNDALISAFSSCFGVARSGVPVSP